MKAVTGKIKLCYEHTLLNNVFEIIFSSNANTENKASWSVSLYKSNYFGYDNHYLEPIIKLEFLHQ